MDLTQARSLAAQLLGEHGLGDWHFVFDNARSRCGSCRYRDQCISLSRHFASLNSAGEVRNVLLHEIAHALAGPGVGHGHHWRRIAARIGARVETCAPDHVAMPAAKWALVCVTCTQVVARRHRRVLDLERVRCGACGVRDGKLVWRAALN